MSKRIRHEQPLTAQPPTEPPTEPPSSSSSTESLETACLAFLSYEQTALRRLEADATALAPCMRILPELAARVESQAAALRANASFFRAMLAELDLIQADAAAEEDAVAPEPSSSDAPAHQIVDGVLAQLRREWSDEGADEREQSFGTLLAALERRLPVEEGAAPPRVLVPGAALGRLVYDLACAGYSPCGVECSYFMLVPARWALERLVARDLAASTTPTVIYPHAGAVGNVSAAAHLRRETTLGAPATQRAPASLSLRLTAGDFEAVCRAPAHREAFDAVASCFFIDATRSVLEIVEVVRAVLKPGGWWVNVGPLLYTHAASVGGSAATPRLCADELVLLLGRSGFDVLEHRAQTCAYCRDAASMCRTEYEGLFFVARRNG
jgi:carnosine N-methyltransferase